MKSVRTVPYAMIGANPRKSDTTTSVGVNIYAMNVNFGAGVPKFDGSANVSSTIASPLFKADSNYGMGGAAKQYEDAMFRAEFWGYLQSSGDTNFNVALSTPSTGPTFSFSMPSNSGTECTSSLYVAFHDGCGAVYCVTSGNKCVGPFFAVIDPVFFQYVILQKAVDSVNINPAALSIFLTSNIVLGDPL